MTVTRDEQGRILRPDGDTQEHANALLDVCGPTRVREATAWLRKEGAAKLVELEEELAG